MGGGGAVRAGLPPPAVTGVRFALEPGVGRSAVPVRSAILGAILAVTVVVATVTFGSSLDTLVSHPALYGWNWTYDMDGGGGLGDVPGQAAAKLLNADPLVESWTRGVLLDPAAGRRERAGDGGHAPCRRWHLPCSAATASKSANQVVLGAATLRQLHKQIGDTVEVRAHNAKPVKLTIVGTATMPPIGVAGSSHLHMGTGALLSYKLIPAAARNLFEVTPGPNAILVRTKGARAARHCARSRPSGASWTSRSTAARCCPCCGRRRSSTTARWARPPCSSAPRWRPGRWRRSASPW